MNQEKIGKFIAKTRKQKELTQGELAEKIGVSINAVSKWERGICLMDMSLLKPLSQILGVSINEILSAEHIKDEDLKNKADQNIINISQLNDLKATKKGVVALSFIAIILIIYCEIKGLDTHGFISMLCGYNGLFYCCKYKYDRNKGDLIAGIVSSAVMFLNIIVFVLNTI